MQWRSQDNTCMYGRVHTARCRICMKLRKSPPGERAGGVALCCPARRYGEVLQAPPAPGAKACLMHQTTQTL